MPPGPRSPWLVHGALFLAAVLFGIGFVATKVVVTAVPPAAWAFVRVLCSGMIVGVVFCNALGQVPRKWEAHWLIAVCALFGITINQALFAFGLQRSTPSHAVIINGMIPFFTMLIGTAAGRDRITVAKGLGFALGVAGLARLLELDRTGWASTTLVGDLLNLGNATAYSLYLVISRPVFQRWGWRAAMPAMFLWGIPGIALIGLMPAVQFAWSSVSTLVWGAMAFMILGPTILAYTANAWAVETVEPSLVAAYVYLQPIIAILLTAVWLGDPVTARQLASAALIFGGLGIATVIPGLARARLTS